MSVYVCKCVCERVSGGGWVWVSVRGKRVWGLYVGDGGFLVSLSMC